MNDLAVSIVNQDNSALLRECLNSILTDPAHPSSSVIWVLDNASIDGSVDMLSAECPHVRVIARDRRRGFAANHNAVLERVMQHARYVLVLNNDTLVTRGALRHLIEFMDSHPRAAAVGPRLVYPDGSPQMSYGVFPSLGKELWRCAGFRKFMRPARATAVLGRLFSRVRPLPREIREYWCQRSDTVESPRLVDWVCGASVLMRREALENVGLFDEESYNMYYEDVDWCRRAWNSGWAIYYDPSVTIIHYGRASGGSYSKIEFERSCIAYFRKHSSRPELYSLKAAVALLTALRLTTAPLRVLWRVAHNAETRGLVENDIGILRVAVTT